MRLPYKVIALLVSFTSAVLTQHDTPPLHPQCPAPPDTHEVHNEAIAQTEPFDSRSSEGGACNQDAQDSPECTEQSTARASGEDRAQERHQQLTGGSSKHGKARRGITRKPQLRTRKTIVLRRPLPMSSILIYQRRRHNLALSEARRNLLQQNSLAVSKHIGRVADKRGRGYRLKLGNYRVGLARPRWVVL